MSEVVKLSDQQATAEEAARRWVAIAQAAIKERGRFDIALSGGTTPRLLYQLMASDEWRDQVPWAQTFVFWGDERRVAPGHEDSNFRMTNEVLLSHVPIPADQIFRMKGEGLGRSAARDYTYELEQHFNLGRREFPQFDLILLGLGADGHFASIFPGTRAVSNLFDLVVAYEVPQLRAERMTLTVPVINNARNILVMVVGETKAQALADVFQKDFKPSTYPGHALKPAGTLTWLVDEAAGSKL